MNLREIIQEVNSLLDYNPDNEDYKTSLARMINRHYLEISGQYPWLFLQKEREITLYAPVSGASGVTVQRDAANFRKVDGVGTSFHSGMDGHTITIDSNDYTIVRVSSTTVLYTASPVTTASATEDWTVIFKDYSFPANCGEPLAFMSRDDDRGRIPFFDAMREEIHHLDFDQSGDPIICVDRQTRPVQSPDIPLLAAVSAGGSLAQEETYQYMYTITEYGRESPPSLVAEATTTAANKTITLSNMVALNYGPNYTGRTRKIYRRIKNSTAHYRFVLIDEQDTSGAGTTYVDNGSVTTNFGTTVYQEKGSLQYFRPWFTPGSDINVDLRYQSVPERLQADADAPEWPRQYHQLLTYKAVQDAAAQHGMTGMATLYERRAGNLMDRMRQRHLSREARDYVRQGWDTNILSRRRYRNGTPTKLP